MGPSSSAPSSSSGSGGRVSTKTAMETIRSPGPGFMTVTPRLARRYRFTLATMVRRMVPSSVMSIISSSSRPTIRIAATSPVSRLRELAMTPPVARCLTGKSLKGVRLP